MRGPLLRNCDCVRQGLLGPCIASLGLLVHVGSWDFTYRAGGIPRQASGGGRRGRR